MLGKLIALYERVVGFYASLVNINAYDQPGVEAGKKAATSVIALQQRLSSALKASPGKAFTADELASSVGGDAELSYKILEHLAANGVARKATKSPWFDSTYSG